MVIVGFSSSEGALQLISSVISDRMPSPLKFSAETWNL